MPRHRVQITSHLSYEEITQRYQQCSDAKEKTRWLVIRLLSQPQHSRRVEEVAELSGFSCAWVRQIARRYNQRGAEGLIDQHQINPGGKKPALTAEQQQQIRERLQQPPEDGGLWNAPKVGELIKTLFGIQLDPSTAWDYLKRLGFSLQLPRLQHQQSATTEQQADFKAELAGFVAWLRAMFPSKSVDIWAEDEARLGLQPIVRRAWALVGQRPVAIHRPRYQWLYTYGFVHPDTGDSYLLLLPRVNLTVMQLALDAFAKQVNPYGDTLIVLLVDRAAWHMSQRLRLPYGIFLFPLPAYTPQLQPTECVWPLLREALANRVFESLDALESALVNRCCWLMEHPDVVIGHVGFDWIQKI
jgi:transposase